jgi:hypothetical protein
MLPFYYKRYHRTSRQPSHDHVKVLKNPKPVKLHHALGEDIFVVLGTAMHTSYIFIKGCNFVSFFDAR